MKIARKESTLVATATEVFDHPAFYIMSLINTYAAIKVHRDFWLTEREKEFFVALIISQNEGIKDFKSQEARPIFDFYFGKHRKGTRGDYVKRLEDKGWLEQFGGDVKLLPLFENLDLDSDESVFEVKYKIRKDDD